MRDKEHQQMMMMAAATEGKGNLHIVVYVCISMRDEVSFVISVLIYDSSETIS